MQTKKALAIGLMLLIATIILDAFVFSTYKKEFISMHASKDVEIAYASKLFALVFTPFLMGFLILILRYLPKIDSLKENYKKFSEEYDLFAITLILFLFVLNLVIVVNSLSIKVNISAVIAVMLSMVAFILGTTLPKIEKNWFFGIRTPWTLKDEKVWKKTHRAAGKVCYAGSILFLVSILSPLVLLFSIIVFIVALLSIVPYSRYLYLRIEKRSAPEKEKLKKK